ncbi:hypothetical protein CDL15_Pgr007557 [Punica granatum]|nr:hypothetical protein CDL15_Pgr007557 [Punica granatum]PKI41101.1 hypothetical protein CRG98_038629 [Punica granatum]
MMLRSSSTPVLGSLLSSHSESPGPGHGHHEAAGKHSQTAIFGHHHQKLSAFHAPTFSCTSSPISPSIVDTACKGFRRAQSEGNLEELVASDTNEDDHFSEPYQARKFPRARPRSGSVLQTIPSFSLYGTRGGYEDEEEESEIDYSEDERDESEDPEMGKPRMALNEGQLDVKGEAGPCAFEGNEMFLAKGLGIGIDQVGGYGGCGGGDGSCLVNYGGDGQENHGVEEYYKKMVKENPNNPLFLRNYAQFLHQTKGEAERADEYYSRAILADPQDGELLSQYAKLVWEFHRDKERAMSYFERAAQASPEDSHVHAAYAGFLWEAEEEGEQYEALNASSPAVTRLTAHHEGFVASTGS